MTDNRPRCSACKGPYSIVTGHVLGPSCQLCGPCTRDFIRWIKQREASMSRKRKNQVTGKKEEESFTDAAIKSKETTDDR